MNNNNNNSIEKTNMLEKYVVNTENSQIETSIDKKNKSVVFVGEKSYTIEELKNNPEGVVFLKINNKNYSIKFSKQGDEVTINTNGFTYKNQIKNLSTLALEKILEKTSSHKAKNPLIKSPMPGLVIKINTEVGATVNKGDKLIVVEAMKMENALATPFDGVVKSISIKEGQAVEKDAVLITLE